MVAEEEEWTKQGMNMEENKTSPPLAVKDTMVEEEDDATSKTFALPGLFDEIDYKGLSLLPKLYRLHLLQKVFHIVVMVYDKEELDRMRRSKKWKAACNKIMGGVVSREQASEFCHKLSSRIPTTDKELCLWQSYVEEDDCLSEVLYLAKAKGVFKNDISDGSECIPPVPFVLATTKPLTLCFRQANYHGFQGVRATNGEREP